MNISTILGDKAAKGQFWTHSKQLVSGCTKVSEGCQNCWAEAMARRFGGGCLDTGGHFDGTVQGHIDRMDDILPMSNRRKPRVWTYWNDIFHRHVPDWFRGLLFDRISRSTDYHIICTKRPEEAVRYLTKAHWNIALDNVIILVTTENQARLDQRRDATLHLHRMDWRVGILAEPLLAPLDLSRLAFIPAWIICGPENGPGKRAFNASWAGSLQYQAKNMGVPFFYKANGGILGGAGPFLECPG